MKKNKKIMTVVSIILFTFCGMGYSQDKKEEMKQYLAKVNPILTNVQMTSRNISQKLLGLEPAVKQMREYISQLAAVKPPVFMEKQHKMILLSFQKMKAGFYILYKGDRSASIPLVRKGAELLRAATRDIVDFAKKEGLVKEKDPSVPPGSGKGEAK